MAMRTACADRGLAVGDHGARLRAGHEAAVGPVGAIDERLRHGLQSRPLGGGEQLRVGLAEDRQRRVVLRGGGDDSLRLGVVVDRRVVQRAVRLDVVDLGAGDLGEGVERAELVEHGVAQLAGARCR